MYEVSHNPKSEHLNKLSPRWEGYLQCTHMCKTDLNHSFSLKYINAAALVFSFFSLNSVCIRKMMFNHSGKADSCLFPQHPPFTLLHTFPAGTHHHSLPLLQLYYSRWGLSALLVQPWQKLLTEERGDCNKGFGPAIVRREALERLLCCHLIWTGIECSSLFLWSTSACRLTAFRLSAHVK